MTAHFHAVRVDELLKRTAASLSRSFRVYWPADAANQNDAAENNVALHLGGVLLAQGYALFAEADHPEADVQGIDLLAMQEEHYFAIELKRIYHGTADLMAEDVRRLQSFRLNRELREEYVGPSILKNIERCRTGIGIVAGLHWVGNPERSAFMDLWRTGEGRGR